MTVRILVDGDRPHLREIDSNRLLLAQDFLLIGLDDVLKARIGQLVGRARRIETKRLQAEFNDFLRPGHLFSRHGRIPS